MSKSALTTVRDWTGLIASLATVLFVMLYPHEQSATGFGRNARQETIANHLPAGVTTNTVSAELVGSGRTYGN